MRRSQNEIHDKNEIIKFLSETNIGRIAFFDKDFPYVVPVHFVFNDDCVYFHCAKEGKKIKLIKENPKVCFEADKEKAIIPNEKACRWSSDFISVIAFGTASLLENNNNEKEKALTLLLKKFSGRADWEFSKANLDEVSVVKIEISEITGKHS
ncbi:MAG: pyridoxamine 5'-phosphate oxidase family protein [Bacteroidales bacterium]|nr:pyridoxamine 5'-phosphate oxidase family protein [Bacteroidales bacterium]